MHIGLKNDHKFWQNIPHSRSQEEKDASDEQRSELSEMKILEEAYRYVAQLDLYAPAELLAEFESQGAPPCRWIVHKHQRSSVLHQLSHQAPHSSRCHRISYAWSQKRWPTCTKPAHHKRLQMTCCCCTFDR